MYLLIKKYIIDQVIKNRSIGKLINYIGKIKMQYFKLEILQKDSKSRPDKPTWRAPKSSSQSRRRDTLAMKVKSPTKPQSVRGLELSSKPC